MKLKALKTIDLFGTRYAKGDSIDVTEQTAERLIRAKEARPAPGEVGKHLAGRRHTTPAGVSREMRVIRR